MSDCCSVKAPAIPATAMACPECGGRSKQVGIVTVKSLVRHLPFGMDSAQYYFCESPACDVVYFPSNAQAPTFRRNELLVRVGLKEAHDPITLCYCFGVSRADIVDEVRQNGKSALAERVRAEVQAGNCACELKNPSGKCCLGNITRAVQDAAGSG